jgi:5-methylcytosine-specific restriction endonuclease McrA
MERKPKTQAQLKKELDKYFSLYIRHTHSDENGNNTCYTCGKPGTIKTMQCGHFVSRQYLATRWHLDNCRIQCAGCNIFGNGKPLDFEERLKKELGDEYVEEMKASRHQSLKLDRHWYQEQIDKYKNLI